MTPIHRFNAIKWHDSKLITMKCDRLGDEELVILELMINKSGAEHVSTKMIFHRAVYVEASLYLTAKRVCADDISGAACYNHSRWIDEIVAKYPHDKFDELLHFELMLIPPGGLINILAEDFSMERPSDL